MVKKSRTFTESNGWKGWKGILSPSRELPFDFDANYWDYRIKRKNDDDNYDSGKFRMAIKVVYCLEIVFQIAGCTNSKDVLAANVFFPIDGELACPEIADY